MSDEMYEFPAVLIVFVAFFSPRGHTGQADAVLNDCVKLAVGERLRRVELHVRGLGVQVSANGRVAASVVGVTDGAGVREVCPGIGEHFVRRVEGTGMASCLESHGQTGHRTWLTTR